MVGPKSVRIVRVGADNLAPFNDAQKSIPIISNSVKTVQSKQRTSRFSSLSLKKIEEDLVRYFIELDDLRHFQGNLYLYQSERGFWQRIDKAQIALELRKYIEEDCSKKISARRMRQLIDTLVELPELAEDFSVQHEKLLNVNNGVVNLETLEVSEHRRDLLFTYCLNFSFIDNPVLDDAPNFLGYLQKSLDYHTIPQKAQCFLEVIGYTISSLRGARKAILWIGKTGAGKSIFLEVIQRVVGKENVSNLALHEIAERFKTAKLAHVRINMASEIKSSALRNLGVWKSVVSGNDRITAETKGGHPFEFVPNVKMIFSGNALPDLAEADDEDAVLDRMKVILFKHKIPRSKWNVNLVENLYKERNIIFSLAIRKLPELIKNNYIFTEIDEERVFMKNYKHEQNSAKEFIDSCCYFEDGTRAHVRPMYDAYVNYCRENAVKAVSESDFKRTLMSHGNVVSQKFRLNGSKPLAGYVGVRLMTVGELLGQDSQVYSQVQKQNGVVK